MADYENVEKSKMYYALTLPTVHGLIQKSVMCKSITNTEGNASAQKQELDRQHYACANSEISHVQKQNKY